MQEQEDLILPVRETAKLAQQTVMPVLLAISLCHLLNDTIQSLISAIYPIVKDSYHLSFTQIGLITFTFQCTASLLQPCVGFYTDRNPKPYSLAVGMIISLAGLTWLAFANDFYLLLASVGLLGVGSAIFHPESSRLARLVSGGRHGFAQSLFQVGGNAGSSFGPLLAALIITRRGQSSILWFTLLALLGAAILFKICGWYKNHLSELKNKPSGDGHEHHQFSRRTVIISLTVLVALVFSKYIYLVSLSSYYTFYLIDKFHVSVAASQIYLFIFLFAVAAGTFMGGPLGDHFGRKYIIWGSILGVTPFTLLLPHVNLFWTAVLTVIIGLILASAFSAIIVYAQELVPGKVGMISGLFFGLAFGVAGIGSAVLGKLADWTSINFVFQVCAFLPLIGFLTAFLPHMEGSRDRAKKA
ncbi:MAG TPA: MFS transporter [Candidatus Acidoferrales bacterium]|jgi:FSR family fosmidomycin resistance protein-like MFS transporter|nr:MFS transporter [Candidatus Acidoferrales bacterium]